MCGIAGYFTSQSIDVAILENMANAILHRGPDDIGVWGDADKGIGLAHRRLSIVDLSPAGHQPMSSPNKRYVIVFNGEIYNHSKLRVELTKIGKAPLWQGHSDTETLLACIDAWGIEKTLQRSTGMFAIALWDNNKRTLTLARDRLGEKPLYYGWQNNTFLFGSELKALKAHPDFFASIDRDSLCLYMRHMYIPAPHSIYEGIAKLPPGKMLVLSANQQEPHITSYWEAVDVVNEAKQQSFTGSADEAVSGLEKVLTEAIDQQMLADVPLGAFLSGGVDSSTIVAMMQAQSELPVKTFSIGFHEEAYNEAEHAKQVAQHLGTEHTEWYVTPKDCVNVIPHLPVLYDEPFADSSQIPTFLVSKLAQQHVTVSLSGDAGDELFCGYQRYLTTTSIWKKLAGIPSPVKQVISGVISPLSKGLCKLKNQQHNANKFHRMVALINSPSLLALYRSRISHWSDPTDVVIGGKEPSLATHIQTIELLDDLKDIEQMMMFDLLTYLPDDILCKVDRAAMGASLETRVPFLDHSVVKFAWQLPLEYKLREGQTKWVLRQVLYRHVPKALIERPKMGFGVPIAHWLRGSLRAWAEDLLSESRLCQDGHFQPALVRKKWQEHLSGQCNWADQLWQILMFNAWLDENK